MDEDADDWVPTSGQMQPEHIQRTPEAVRRKRFFESIGATNDVVYDEKLVRVGDRIARERKDGKRMLLPKPYVPVRPDMTGSWNMMPSGKGKVETLPSGVAVPNKHVFDPWNSMSTGHQRAENRLAASTAWRDSRDRKLKSQYSAGASGGKRLFDTVGAGSAAFGKDGRKANGSWRKGAAGLRAGGQKSIVESFQKTKTFREEPPSKWVKDDEEVLTVNEERAPVDLDETDSTNFPESEIDTSRPMSTIFRGLSFYINGSTMPVGDLHLRYLITQNGGSCSLALMRRKITHVILGPGINSEGHHVAGGGLAAGKIQKELAHLKKSGIYFISVAWVLDSIEAGERLPESRYAEWKMAAKNQPTVMDALTRKRKAMTSHDVKSKES